MRFRLSRYFKDNVVAFLALFVALGGTGAYAANTVFSSDIADGEVKSIDIGNNEIGSSDVKDQSLSTFDVHTFLGADVVDNTLTGDDVDESTLNLAAGPWHEVGAEGEPAFGSGFSGDLTCTWANYGESWNTASFLRDRFGFVHIRGLVKAADANAPGCGFTDQHTVIFQMPAGYAPAAQNIHAALTNNALQRVNVNPTGRVEIEFPGGPGPNWDNAKQWVSLDGISVRCAPSGLNGCP